MCSLSKWVHNNSCGALQEPCVRTFVPRVEDTLGTAPWKEDP